MSDLKAVVVELTQLEGPPERCSAAVEVRLEDGRQFSILAATPSWFEAAFAELGLRFYFGPSILFVSKMELPVVRKAVDAMARLGDQLFCRYDTPRTTLRQVLAAFKARHP